MGEFDFTALRDHIYTAESLGTNADVTNAEALALIARVEELSIRGRELFEAIECAATLAEAAGTPFPFTRFGTPGTKGYGLLRAEGGPELVNFTDPGRVYTAAETQAMLAGRAQAEISHE